MPACRLPSQRPIFTVWDGTFTPCMPPAFRPGGPFSTFGTELLLPACFPSSVPEALFHRLGRNFHGLRMFRETSDCLEHGTGSTPRIISNEKQSPNGLCFIVGGDGGSRTHVQEYFRKTFSERSRLLLFRSPVALRQTRGFAIPWILLRYREITQEVPACMTPDSFAAGDEGPTRGAELCSQCEVVVCFSVSS